MKRRLMTLLIVLSCMIICVVPTQAADGNSYVYDGYIYDYWKNVKDSPAAFVLETVITADHLGGIPLSSVDDVCTSQDGRIFIADKVEGRVHVLDERGNLIHTLKTIRGENGKIVINEDGRQLVLNGTEGVFLHEKNKELYIADTLGTRIIILDSDTYAYKRQITKPDNMTGSAEFKPSKVVVDQADRIYVVIQSSYEGIVELNEDGSFSRYFGVNAPKVNLVDYFWKSLASDTQKIKMAKTYAPAFNNIALDGEGFVMAVTYDSAAESKVFRLNSAGENVLREEGSVPVIGDLYNRSAGESKFVDIAITRYGTYAVIDKERGRIFLYNFDGELLNIFGTIGNLKGEFKNPTSIAWLGDKLVVSDSTLKCIYILCPTEFGETILRGEEAYYYGEWDTALGYFEEAIRLNANYEIAYSGIGKNHLMKDDYENAMYYFKLGNNRSFYSKAYSGYRNNVLKDHFYIIAIILVLVIVAVIYSEIRYFQKEGGTKR